MKYLSPTPIAFAAALALSSQALAQQSSDPTSKIVEIEGQIDEALYTFGQLVELQEVQPSDLDQFASLADAWAEAVSSDFPEAEEVRERLNRYIAHVESTVSKNFLRLQHVAEMKERFVEAKLDRALSILEDRARDGDWTSEQYFAVVRLFHERAEAAVDEPDAESVRARLQEMLDSALSRGYGIGAELTEVYEELNRARLARRIQQARQAAKAGEDTTVYRLRIAELLMEREQLGKEVEGTN